jgi:hypothetical protein
LAVPVSVALILPIAAASAVTIRSDPYTTLMDATVVVVAKGADLPGSEVGESIGFGVDVGGFEVEV